MWTSSSVLTETSSRDFHSSPRRLNRLSLAWQCEFSFQYQYIPQVMASHPSGTNNVVGVHYRVGKKIGEGSFGVIFEGTPAIPPSILPHTRSQAQTSSTPPPSPSSLCVSSIFPSPPSSSFLVGTSQGRSSSTARRMSLLPHPRRLSCVSLSPSIPLTNVLSSRDTSDLPLRSRGSTQHSGHRPSRPQLGRSFRHVWTQVLHQDCLHGRKADGATHFPPEQ